MKIISHRGNDNHHYLENTIEAITTALSKDYIDGAEIDIHLTKDNKLILSHDNDITFNNQKYLLTELEYDKIKKLFEENNTKLYTLNELLENLTTTKELLIELKCEDKRYNEYINEVYLTISKRQQLNIKICSFNYELLKQFKAKYSEITIGLIIGKIKNLNNIKNIFDFNSFYEKHSQFVKNGDYIWTIEDPKKIIKIRKHKQINVITDFPYKFRGIKD